MLDNGLGCGITGGYLNGLLSFQGLGWTTDGMKTAIFLVLLKTLLLNSIESRLYINHSYFLRI